MCRALPGGNTGIHSKDPDEWKDYQGQWLASRNFSLLRKRKDQYEIDLTNIGTIVGLGSDAGSIIMLSFLNLTQIPTAMHSAGGCFRLEAVFVASLVSPGPNFDLLPPISRGRKTCARHLWAKARIDDECAYFFSLYPTVSHILKGLWVSTFCCRNSGLGSSKSR